MATNLEPYGLPKVEGDMLEQVLSQPAPMPILEVSQKRPKPFVLRKRVMGELSVMDAQLNRYPDEVMEAVRRSIQNSWDCFTEVSVAPNEFMRTPFGAPYEVVTIEGKGRGMQASRAIKASEIILQDSPMLILPPESSKALIFLTLPQKALESNLLLHSAKPEYK